MTRQQDLEELAALAEGMLSGPDRERVVERIDASDELADVYADAAAALRELEAEDGIRVADEDGAGEPEGTDAADAEPAAGTPVTPLRPPSTARRGWRSAPARWMALAAVLAGVLLVPLALSRRGGDPGDPGRLVALLEHRGTGLPADYDRRPWSVTRGAGDPLTDEARAARLGALLVDLELAVAGRQVEQTRLLAMQVRAHLEDVPAAGPIAAVYADVERRAGEDPEALTGLLREGRSSVAAMLPEEHFALGAWAEAARMAAARRDAEFFASSASRRALDRAIESPALDADARAAAERLRARTERARAATPDWPALAAGIDELLHAIG